MIIRQQQMESFSDYMRQQFEKRMAQHLRAKFADHIQALDEPALQNLVVSGIRKAEVYGIDFEDDIRRYLEYMMVLSPDFDTNPSTSWAGNILRGRDSDGAQKIDEIGNIYLFARG